MGFIEQQAAAWSDVYQQFKGNEARTARATPSQ